MSFILSVKMLNYSYILLFIHSYSFPHTITNIVIVTNIVSFIVIVLGIVTATWAFVCL